MLSESSISQTVSIDVPSLWQRAALLLVAIGNDALLVPVVQAKPTQWCTASDCKILAKKRSIISHAHKHNTISDPSSASFAFSSPLPPHPRSRPPRRARRPGPRGVLINEGKVDDIVARLPRPLLCSLRALVTTSHRRALPYTGRRSRTPAPGLTATPSRSKRAPCVPPPPKVLDASSRAGL